jgi:two-component system chemotaxis response regulator CheB
MPPDAGGARRLIVVGASAGGVEALTALVRELPERLPAALAIVLHVAPSGTSVLPAILNRAGRMTVRAAVDGDVFREGCIYVAPPDLHLEVEDGRLALRHGPRENAHRPAVDRLFRTAADAYGPGAIGVILSGTLDDGAAGLAAIKRRGGCTVVQDPDDALYPGMPRNAISRATPDHVVPLADIPRLLVDILDTEGVEMTDDRPEPRPSAAPPGRELDAGPEMPAGDAAGLSCPECGGALWYVVEGHAHRFRCRIGHAYSEASLMDEHGRALEIALWTALRALEERAGLLRRMARRADDAGHPHSARSFRDQASNLDRHAAVVRDNIVPTATAGGQDVDLVATGE